MAIASVAANMSAMSTMQSEALEKRTVNTRDQPIGPLLNTKAYTSAGMRSPHRAVWPHAQR